MADVSTPCAAYKAAAHIWEQVEDAAAGEAAVKACGNKYLPYLNKRDVSQENIERNKAYVQRAVFYNATGRTLESLVGLAFKKDPEIKTPAELDDVVSDIDGAGTTLIQQAHEATGEVVKVGRLGLLADFPRTTGNTSKADERLKGIRPTINFYPATSVINWRTEKLGGQVRLALVVLRETYAEYVDFEEKDQQQYRVLRLNDGGYVVEIWRQRVNDSTRDLEWYVFDTFMPADGNGQALDFIPFVFVGSRANTANINKAPLVDIASLNFAHYRNSADYEDSVFICGQPQFWISGLTEEWRDHLEKSGIYVGSRSVLPLPANGGAGVLQAQPNTLAKEAMGAKESQMAALGARLIMVDGTVKTATQQDSEDSTANSVLSLCCDNVSAAYTLALSWCAIFANAAGECSLSIPTDFTKYSITPQELSGLMGAVQAGLMPLSDFWARLRLAGVIAADKTDGDIKEEIDAMTPPGLANPGVTDPSADATA